VTKCRRARQASVTSLPPLGATPDAYYRSFPNCGQPAEVFGKIETFCIGIRSFCAAFSIFFAPPYTARLKYQRPRLRLNLEEIPAHPFPMQ